MDFPKASYPHLPNDSLGMLEMLTIIFTGKEQQGQNGPMTRRTQQGILLK